MKTDFVEMEVYDALGSDIEFQAFITSGSLTDIVTSNLSLMRVFEELESRHACLQHGPMRLELLKLRKNLESAGVLKALHKAIKEENNAD